MNAAQRAGASSPPAARPASYTLKRVQEMLGLSRHVVDGLIATGFVAPTRGSRNEFRFSFQDLLVLRTAHSLQQAKIAPRKILRALAHLRKSLPAELPITGLRVSAVGAEVVVHDRSGDWDAGSGQLLMDFEVAPRNGTVTFLRPAAPLAAAAPDPTPSTHDAEAWFRRGTELEGTDPAAAEIAYRQALALSPAYVSACLNLGAMLCDAGRCDDAVRLYEAALAAGAADATLHFNHAIALEDQQRTEDALASYRKALALDAGFADAHFNIGHLLEAIGDAKGALRHFGAYKRLQPKEDA